MNYQKVEQRNSCFKIRYILFLGIFILMVDVLSKYLTQHFLPLISLSSGYPYGGIGVFKNFFGIEFSLIHAINYGAAWGILHQYTSSLLVFRIIFVVFLIFYTFFSNRKFSQFLSFVLIISGALGNIFDYFVYGHVIDMFHFIFWGYQYPVFNVADSAITLGVVGLVFQNLFSQSEKRK